MPTYLDRIAALPTVIAVLRLYPDGLTLRELADQCGVTVKQLSEDLTYLEDLESWGWDYDVFCMPDISFTTNDAGETGVRLTNQGTQVPLGVEHFNAGDLAAVYTAGVALAEAEPNNQDLLSALQVLTGALGATPLGLPVPPTNSAPGSANVDWVAELNQAIAEQRRVRFGYSRAWAAGVSVREIEPLALTRTRRGWEVDAGPPDKQGRLRTFLLDHMSDLVVLGETFEAPRDRSRLLARQRRTTAITMSLPQGAAWATTYWAEREVRLEGGSEESFVVELHLLEPLAQRVAMLILAGGPDSRLVKAPPGLLDEALAVVSQLRQHYAEPVGPDFSI